jgi:hypothetical protein
MNNTGFMVYWTQTSDNVGSPHSMHFTMAEMTAALAHVATLRELPEVSFVTFVSQNPDSVGKPGVSDKLPEDYSWSKQHRAGTERGKSRSLVGAKSNE